MPCSGTQTARRPEPQHRPGPPLALAVASGPVEIVSNVTACKLALTTRAHDFLTANDGPNFLRAARALSVHFPPLQRVADVSERIEDLSDVPDATLAQVESTSAVKEQS